jgi:hypothetical protein
MQLLGALHSCQPMLFLQCSPLLCSVTIHSTTRVKGGGKGMQSTTIHSITIAAMTCCQSRAADPTSPAAATPAWQALKL